MIKNQLFCCAVLVFLLAGCAGRAPEAAPTGTPTAVYWPSAGWLTSTPEEQGVDSEQIVRMFQQINDQGINLHSLLIARHGILVTEAYFQPYTQDQLQYLASVTKSVIGTLVGIAIQQGSIQDVDQTLVSYFPDRTIANLDERKKSITLKDLLTLTAGLECTDSFLSGEPGMEGSSDWVQFMLDAPMAEQPGTVFNYCGGAVHLLSAILQQATGMTAREFANQELFAPLGIAEVTESHWPTDPQGISTGPYGLYLVPRDLVKLGYLYLRDGFWDGQQILPTGWVQAATTRQTTKENGLGYGYLWTVDPEQGSYSALGLAGQQIYVIPEKDLVVVFTGTLPSDGPDKDFIPLKALVDDYVLPAVKSDQPLPENPTAADQVAEVVETAVYPIQPVQPIPEGALAWSGVVYALEENPNGWQTLSFSFDPGGDSVLPSVNGAPIDPPIGLDNIFRVQSPPEGGAPLALRGAWEDENTLAIELVYLGELGDNEVRVVFSPDAIEFTTKAVVTGQEMTIHGVRAEE